MGLQGMAAGAVFGPWGAAIGGGIGAIAGLFGPTEYEQRTRQEAADRKDIVAAVDMDSARSAANFTGRNDLLDQFLRVQNSAAPEYLKQLLGELDEQTKRLTGAMERYGITWEELGEKARQSRINETAKEFLLDFDALVAAGADVDFIIGKMGASMNEFVLTAQRTGTEVPVAMKPMLQRMIDLGILTDESGEAFGSLEESGITFAKTMTEGFDSIVAAIDRVAKALGYVFDEYDGKTITMPVSTPGLPPSKEAPEDGDPNSNYTDRSPEAHTGGYLTPWGAMPRMHSGGEVPIIAQTGEYMMQRTAVQKYGRGFMQAVNQGNFSAGPRTIIIKSYVQLPDARILAEAVARETLQ
jgi:hypothetical protein